MQEKIKDDTISRQAAIDALDFEIVHMTAYCDGKNEGNPFAQYNKGLEDGKKAIKALPTVQPEKAQLSKEDTTSDLISRQAVINAIENTNAKMSMPEWDEITNAVMSLPTIQPEPQEGHWIRTDCGLDVECKCSKCGYRDFVAPRDEYWFKRNYCPNCGAKMKGVKHETN